MTSNSEIQLLDLYEKIKGFIYTLIETYVPINENKINTYNTLRTEYGEYLDFFQSENDKEKALSSLLHKFMKFTRLVLNIYKEQDLDNFSKILFSQILGTEFNKDELIKGFIELKTYLCANELKRLRNINNTDTLDKELISDTLMKYFPNKRLKYINNPSINSEIYDSLSRKKEELEYIFISLSNYDSITYFSQGKRLRKIWIPAINDCLHVFDKLFYEIKNRPSHSTDEQPNVIEDNEVFNEEDDSIPNNQQQQLNTKKQSKSPEFEPIENANTREESPVPQSSQLQKSPSHESLNLSSSSKRNVSETELLDEELSESKDSTYRNQAMNAEIINNQPELIMPIVTSRSSIQNGSKRRKKWTPVEIRALEEGMEKYGPRWTKIMNAYPHELADRESMQLRDKARNVFKSLKSTNKDLGVYKKIQEDENYSNL